MNAQTLIRWGGLVTVVAAALLILGTMSNLSARTAVGQWCMIAGFVVLVFAMMALYGAQATQSGLLGLVGFVLIVVGATLAPIRHFATLARVSGVDPDGAVRTLFNATLGPSFYFSFILGVILFGLATVRAGVLPRWARVLLGVGGGVQVLGLIVSQVLGGESGVLRILGTVAPVAGMLGFAGMGWALWSGKGAGAAQANPAIKPAGAG